MKEAISYGGNWTDKKLAALRAYLQAYLKVFKNQRDWVTLYYIDAFAGPGLWQPEPKEKKGENLSLPLIEHAEEDAKSEEYKQGSPMIALGMPEPGFDKFIFIEKKESYVDNLEIQVKAKYPNLNGRVEFIKSDANVIVRDRCNNWGDNARAVIFLDPFGTEVEWQTIEAIAKTKSMDLWVLFPVGIAVNRMLTTDGDIHPRWEEILNSLFGTRDWRKHFYRESPTLFSYMEEEGKGFMTKAASFEKIAAYFIERLKSVFPATGVVNKPLMLRNSTNNPLFALCFAAGNQNGARIAVNIAKYIIEMKR